MPWRGPTSVSTVSTKLGLSSLRLMTACSKFDDFEKKRTFFGLELSPSAGAHRDRPRPSAAAPAPRINSRRFIWTRHVKKDEERERWRAKRQFHQPLSVPSTRCACRPGPRD